MGRESTVKKKIWGKKIEYWGNKILSNWSIQSWLETSHGQYNLGYSAGSNNQLNLYKKLDFRLSERVRKMCSRNWNKITKSSMKNTAKLQSGWLIHTYAVISYLNQRFSSKPRTKEHPVNNFALCQMIFPAQLANCANAQIILSPR